MSRYQQIAVWPALARYVAAIQVESDGSADTAGGTASVPAPLLPTPYPVIGFQLRGRLAILREGREQLLERSGITLLQRTARQVQPRDGACSVLVTLQPSAAYALTGWPMHELADEHIGLAALLPAREVRTIEERLAEAPDAATCGELVQARMLALFARSKAASHPLVEAAAAKIVAGRGRQRIHLLAESLGVSERQLERLFRAQIGAGPKAFAALVQFDWVQSRLTQLRSVHAQGGRERTLADLALVAGYADQAHLTRAFVARTGLPPTAFASVPAT